MIDPLFGDITFTKRGGWQGTYTYPFLGHDVTVTLALGGDEGEPIDDVQRDAMERFNIRKDELCAQAADALYAEYLERRPELREQFGTSADELMPIINGKQGLSDLVTPTELVVREPVVSNDRVIGLLYDCTWEPELGLAVKFVNETVEEVGPQDIVL